MKVNCNPDYIHPNSNHPILLLSINIEFRISVNSSCKEVFNKHSEFYNSALGNSGCEGITIDYRILLIMTVINTSRNIICFNTAFNLMVKLNFNINI